MPKMCTELETSDSAARESVIRKAIDQPRQFDQRHRVDERVVRERASARQRHAPRDRIDSDDAIAINEPPRIEPRRDRLPDRAGAAGERKAESRVRSPRDVVALLANVVADAIDVGHRHALADPTRAEELEWIAPHFEVVRRHENVREPLAEHRHDPFAKVLRLRQRRPDRGRVFESAQRALAIVGIEPVDVVLERIRNEAIADPDPRLALVVQPLHAEESSTSS